MKGRLAPFLAAVGLLGATGFALVLPHEVAPAPLARPLQLLPMRLGDWEGIDGVPPLTLREDSQARVRLSRTYRRADDALWFAADYYPEQSEGLRPRAQELLYPGQGWTELSARTLELALGDGRDRPLPLTAVTIRTPARALVVLYWYQLGSRSVAGDHWYRAHLLFNRIARGRAEVLLVRIAAPTDTTQSSEALTSQTDFIRALYPQLLRHLPR